MRIVSVPPGSVTHLNNVALWIKFIMIENIVASTSIKDAGNTLDHHEHAPLSSPSYSFLNLNITEHTPNIKINYTKHWNDVDRDVVFSDWWSENIWKHLYGDVENNTTLDQSIENCCNESSYFYDYDDDEEWASSNESRLNDNNIWEKLSAYFTSQQIPSRRGTNYTQHHDMEPINPTYPWSDPISRKNPHPTSKLDDTYLYKKTTASIQRTTNESYKTISPEYSYPPWETLTLKQQNTILEMAQGSSTRHGAAVTIGLTAYYGALLLVGIPGNGLTCLIILTNSYMRTAPNLFLLNIALADLVTLFLSKKW